MQTGWRAGLGGRHHRSNEPEQNRYLTTILISGLLNQSVSHVSPSKHEVVASQA